MEQYVLAPGAGSHARSFDSARFLSAWSGRSDPWVDLALTSVSEWGSEGEAKAMCNRLLDSWVPNRIAMRDDGEGADRQAGDGIWSLGVELPLGASVEYKFTNSGQPGSWVGEELAVRNRSLRVEAEGMRVRAIFGQMGD
ncbi:MAG: hypothetical protein CME06_01480 [Gemmatimonadetes bacterium]|nr:hypothetical protein [Gemmatimonadota bacterium]